MRLVVALLFVSSAFAQPALENLNAILWAQTSAEYAANATQTYRAARRSLVEALRDKGWTAALEQAGDYSSKAPAVILDLDETILDNSAYRVQRLEAGKGFDEASWRAWVREERAGAVPGAIEFLKFAHARGVALFYVTNRDCSSEAGDATRKQLEKLLVPLSNPSRLLCRTGGLSDKSPRRAAVAGEYRILLLIGDDFGDFLTVPSGQATVEARRRLFRTHVDYWGERWFMLPNPMYGSWERIIGEDVAAKRKALEGR